MNKTINVTKLSTIPEQVYQNTQDIATIKSDIDVLETGMSETESKAQNALTTAQDALTASETSTDLATSALATAQNALSKASDAEEDATTAQATATTAQATADKAVQGVNNAWEKDFIDVIIKPEDFDPSLIITLSNELYTLENVITIAPTPDDGVTINNNAKNIAYYELRPLVQIQNGQLRLKASELPSVNLYLKIQVEIQIEVI